MGDTPTTRRDDLDLDSVLDDWSLSAADLREIDRTRSLESRLWTALHLCSLRQTGRFAEDPERIPHEAIVYLAHQIGIEPPARLLSLHRQATDSAIRTRVQDYLGFAAFSPEAQARLTARLADIAIDALGTAILVERAERLLLADRITLPSRTALERLVLSVNRHALQTLFIRIVTDLRASAMSIRDEDLVHVWPLQRRHITPHGVYFVNRTMPAFILPDPAET